MATRHEFESRAILYENVQLRFTHILGLSNSWREFSSFSEQFCALWQEITRRSSNPFIGLQMARVRRPRSWDALSYAIHSSANLGEAFDRVVRYSRFRHTGAQFTFAIEDSVACVTMALPNSTSLPSRAFCEWVGAQFVLLAQRLTGTDLVPLRMGFQHSKPDDLSEYDRFFRCPLAFDQPVNEMRLNASFVECPLMRAEPGLSTVLDRYIEELLARLPQAESFLDTIRRIVSQELQGGDSSLTAIAKRLGYAPRTLQRKLQESGTSYYTLLDEMRRELSIYYLQEKHIAISEVAFLLGFSETSAFHRAFRRWTGVSPREFRRSA